MVGMVQAAVNYTPLTPLSFLARTAYVYPEKTAVVYQDTRYTYRQFQQRAQRLATALHHVGVVKGDRVAFLCPNIPHQWRGKYIDH
jgi:fatty-acyl-CoA synthase